MAVRLDKWLMVSRVFRTRSRAARACSLGRVRVNGYRAKPHRPLSVGDRLEIELRDHQRVLIVRELKDRPVRKDHAAQLYEDQSPPKPELDPVERMLRSAPARRERGAGRPTKRERRKLDRARAAADDGVDR